MNPLYFQDMQIVDERLTALESEVSKILEIVSNQEQMIKVLSELIKNTHK